MDDYKDQIIYFPKRNVPIVVPTRPLIVGAAVFAFVLFLALACRAQQVNPAQTLMMDWQAMLAVQNHVGASMQAVTEEADARLKWVLDNWVPKQPPAPQANK